MRYLVASVSHTMYCDKHEGQGGTPADKPDGTEIPWADGER